MTRKKQRKPGEKVGLTLTQAERMLLLNAMHGLTEEIRDVMRATPTAQPVMLTLDNLDDLEGHVAAEANQTKDKKLRQRLDEHARPAALFQIPGLRIMLGVVGPHLDKKTAGDAREIALQEHLLLLIGKND